jgi:FPC/CPF motif-containing protein YcgG
MDPRWVFWFEGIDFFVNFSTPSHQRRSRNLGSAMTMVVQARSSFDDFAEPDNRIRALIRSRVQTYDDMPVHPAIGTYGDPTSREATQYFLGDSNDITIDLLTQEDIVRSSSSGPSAEHAITEHEGDPAR